MLPFVSFGVNIQLHRVLIVIKHAHIVLEDVHYSINSFYPEPNQPISCGQLYILDFSEANREKL